MTLIKKTMKQMVHYPKWSVKGRRFIKKKHITNYLARQIV